MSSPPTVELLSSAAIVVGLLLLNGCSKPETLPELRAFQEYRRASVAYDRGKGLPTEERRILQQRRDRAWERYQSHLNKEEER